MFNCSSCGYECGSMDLYYDHLIFDQRHRELAQKEAASQRAARTSRRMSRPSSLARASSLAVRKQASEPTMERAKRLLVYGMAGY
ncbi:hypothetical protein H4R21_005751 [Coemansia helicoidea]|uniref:Uncharacterized protein n=1 Tax=Coemansia helicoidea TaxID=1286919 RepID=A0ACC1KSJ3_9FUNG|nr:hypothetical protein H4R21_005751 [Coemansia helicoidea]